MNSRPGKSHGLTQGNPKRERGIIHRKVESCSLLRLLCFFAAILASVKAALAQEPAVTLTGHTNTVSIANYSPDGKLIVTGSFDRTLKIWNATGGEALRTLEGHKGQVLSLAVSPNGRSILSGSRTGTIKLWDLYNPLPLRQLAGHTDAVSVVEVAGDGTWLATAGADTTVKLWNRADGKLLFTLEGHEAAVTRAAISKDGKLLATSDAAGVVRLWNPADGKPLGTIGAHPAPVSGLAFHPTTPTLLTAGESGTAKLWTLPLVEPKTISGHTMAVNAVAISKDGKLILTGGADAKVQVVNGETGATGRALAGQVGPVTALALNADASLAVSGNDAGAIKLWATADGADRLGLLGHDGAVHGLAVNAAGDQIASSGADGTVRVWRLPVAAQPLAGHTMPVGAVAVSGDEKMVATGSADKSVRLWNAADGAAVRTLAGHTGAVGTVAFNAANTQLASGGDTGEVRLFNVADGAAQGVLAAHNGSLVSLHYHPDGKQLISIGADGAVKWWQLPLTSPKALPPATDAVTKIALTADGKQLIVGDAKAGVRILDPATGAAVRTLAGQTGAVTALATGGGLVAAAGDDGAIKFWNLADGADRLSATGHDGAVNGLAFHPQGKQIASAGADGTIRIWNLPVAAKALPGTAMPVTVVAFSNDGTLMASAAMVAGKPTIVVRSTTDGAVKATLLGHAAAVTSLAFSVDKTKLISGSADKTARVWNLADAKFPEIAKFELAASVTAVAFDAGAANAFTGAADNSLKQWTVADSKEVRTLAGHTGAISSLAVAGTTLVSGGADMTARLWNTTNGQAIRSVSHAAAITTVAISANGQTIATGGAGKNVKLWNAANGAATGTLAGHAGPIANVAFSTDGKRIATASTDGVRTWDATGAGLERFTVAAADAVKGIQFASDNTTVLTGDVKHMLRSIPSSLVRVISGHQGAVTDIAFATAGTSVISGGADKTVRMWTVADGKQTRTFAGPTDAITALNVSADGKLLAAASADKAVRVWDLTTAPPAGQPASAKATFTYEAAVRSVAFSADATRLAAGGDDKLVRVWDLASGRELERLPDHTEAVSGIEFSVDGKMVFSGSADKSTQVWTLAATRVIATDETKIIDASLSTDGAMLATASADKKVKLWDVADGKLLHELPVGTVDATSVSLRGDKTQIAATASDMSLQIWPLAATGPGTVVKITLPAAATRVRFSKDGLKLAVSGADKNLRIYDSTGKLLESIPTADAASALAFAPDGQSLVTSSANNANLQPLSLLRLITGHEGAVTGIAFSPDGTAVVSGGADKTVRMWTLADGKQTATFAGATDAITGLSLSADGKLLAASSADKNVRTWAVAAAAAPIQPTATFAHTAAVRSVSISADATRIATSGDDKLVQVWDVATGRELERFAGHAEAVHAVAFAGDGKTVISGSADKSARLWTVAASKIVVADKTKVNDVAFLPDGSQFATTGDEMLVKFWGANGAMARQLAGAKMPLTRLEIRGDAAQAAATDTAGNVLVWTLADNALKHTIETGAVANDITFSADNLKLAIAGADNHLRVFNPEDASPLQDQTAAMPLLAARFVPESNEIITGSTDKNVSFWSYASPVAVKDLVGHTGAAYGVAFSPDGKLAASCSADASIRIWDLATGQSTKQLAGHAGAIYNVRFSADGKQLLSAGADGTVRLWDAIAGTEVKKFALPIVENESPIPVFDASINATGTQIAAASGNQILVWIIADGKLARTVEGHEDTVYRVEFNADSSRLLSCGHAGNLMIWNAADGAQVTAIKLPSVSYAATFSPVESKVITAGADQKAHVSQLP